MANLYRVRTIFSGPAGTPWYNNLFFTEAGGSAQDAADAVATFWGAADAFMKSTISWATDTAVYVIDASNGEAGGIETVTNGGGTGGSSDDLLPRATQAVISLRTGVFVGGREVRGRIFVPGLTEASCATDGTLATTPKNTLATAANAIVSDAGNEFVVWSRTHGVGHLVSACQTDSEFGVMRSRRD